MPHTPAWQIIQTPRRPHARETSGDGRASDLDWEQRLADALTASQDCRWPLDLLHHAPSGAER